MAVAVIVQTWGAVCSRTDGLLIQGREILARAAEPQADWLRRRGYTSDQITATRLISTPGICALIAYQQYILALLAIIAAAWTDNIDGIMARKEGKSESSLGGLLDSLTDKAFIVGILFTIYYYDAFRENFMLWIAAGEIAYGTLAVLFFVISVLIGTPVADVLKKLKSTGIGKAKMVSEICLMICIVLFVSTAFWPLDWIAYGLGWKSFILLCGSFLGKVKSL
ncbi:MAG: hypothetical protein A3C85_01325 [Candidatus Doudnabacteria bacterium RIFCSPHIGHO2_02_FULL_48_21]|uniref:CDP-alcohol phosphatidyltransferase n=1 Tax=Candidatus Doudnabacteria bacterium RIFCSPLOWO2_02_FULL_48_13 TaxID=1817845 RepID=A0A1F5Q946_9BACT|nr:MAG: hypothetical protein A3K05_04370 [Candidatus Doudnabacteria bacterium RIFCSPHIGHO2_01_48_18]OGE79598.1 MAG: hypothetical protein A2668_03380 [Candidatus Doudnabacteria bacterium RIFCSPHIGHO2_01_FULL_48_180]OGE91125.1 MAG: hypothetical protein A3F44_02265 [Candidatus Doudnabacteria bacterium RIFCSPHIGHO2_12_FULL_47_25]OGE93815.1 MAG: hypothetical protein A3C85_01325 [Candidatus Doudnabacteria bacterium RIFCSPHIGHO2_02_FULL_48_21]OGE98001.1 MAG: hypothetical protein A3A83_00910 [Candidatu